MSCCGSFDFDASNLEGRCDQKTVQEAVKYQEKNTVTWLNIDGLHNIEIMERDCVQSFLILIHWSSWKY